MEIVSTVSQRLTEMMIAFSLSQTDIAAAADLNHSVIHYYIKEKRKPKVETLKKIADVYGLSINWLLGYDVEMFTENKDEVPAIYVPKSLDGKYLKIIGKMNQLSDDQLEFVYDMVCFMSEKNRKN